KDDKTSFWMTYERVVKQHDEEFLELRNVDLDSLLIFINAGLFSAVSSAFIVDMESALQPDPSDTANALLMIIAQNTGSLIFSNQTLSLPIWTGPGPFQLAIQCLAYLSLSLSLLSAFGAVLAKQ
ncbi:hypothetical protein M422DRAFT_96507, partial [Sphaerobolus stellatus SS14]